MSKPRHVGAIDIGSNGIRLLVGTLGSATQALMPLIAHDLLKGGASLFGVLLGCTGVGAVAGAMSIAWLRTLPVRWNA